MVHWLIPHGQATIGGSLQGRAYVSNHGPNVINCHVRLPLSIAATQAFEVSNASRIARLFSRPAKHGIVTPLGAGEQPDVQEQIARHPEVRRRIAERERGDRTS